jgi:hypothetical protein
MSIPTVRDRRDLLLRGADIPMERQLPICAGRALRTGFLIFTVCLALRTAGWAQGTFPTNSISTPLVINFTALSNSPLAFLPSGTGAYGGTSNGGSCVLYIDASTPANISPATAFMTAKFTQMDAGGNLTPITFPDGNNPAFNIIGQTGAVNEYEGIMELTPELAQELLDGQLFVEADFTDGIVDSGQYSTYAEYLGQLTPTPEPTSLELAGFAVALFGFVRFFALHKRPLPNGHRATERTDQDEKNTKNISRFGGRIDSRIIGTSLGHTSGVQLGASPNRKRAHRQ